MTSSLENNYKTRAAERSFGPIRLERSLAPKRTEEDDLMMRGFALAHFLFTDRAAAMEILVGAVNKLKAKVGQEHKRAYWRDKFLKRQITRVTREDHDTLQWLIYFESDSREKEQEAQGRAGIDDMLVRYIKTLVRISTGMSSFYVNVAMHRLLHSYTTSETQEIYEMVADSYRGADGYRRAKRLLMLKLESRFAGRMRVVRTDHGEVRYELAEDPERCRELAFQCLRLFTPWSTQDKCPLKNYSGTSSYQLHEAFRHDFDNRSDQDKIEITRCHAFIDPDCLGHLAKALGLEQHSSKLGIPRFYMDIDQNERPPSSRLPATSLTDQERRSIEGALAEEEARRKRVVARVIAFVVDGAELARVDVEKERGFQFDVPFGAKLIEMWGEDEQGPLVLATHIIAHCESADQVLSEFILPLRGDQSVSVATARRRDEEAGSYTISVSVGAKKRDSSISRVQQWLRRPPVIPAYAGMLLMLLALTFLWIGYRRGSANERVRMEELRSKATQELAARSGVSERVVAAARSYRLTPDDLITRGSSSIEDYAIVLPLAPALIDLELPVAAAQGQYSVALRPIESRQAILVANNLVPANRASGAVLTFSLPSTMLAPSRYYRVELREMGQTRSLSTFTFHTAPTQQ